MKGLKKTIFSENKTQKINNKKGMTYVELLCALSLLMLIVVMFTPMLLSSYDTLYTAGEKTAETYSGKKNIETSLTFRERNDNLPDGLSLNFNNLTDTLVIHAKQALTSVEGLETLYSTGKGKIDIVSDLSVPDNQDAQYVKLKLTNLDYTSGNTAIDKIYYIADSVITDKSTVKNKVAFYFAGAFDPNTKLDATIIRYPNFNKTNTDDFYPYIEIMIKGVDITDSPIKIMAFYLNEFGNLRTALAHLYITPADVMFVGETSAKDYFTSAGVDEEGAFLVSGRDFQENTINGAGKLNDVEWISTGNDSTINEGYYTMCGDNGIVRRLWHLDIATLNVGNRKNTFGSDDYVYYGEVSYPFKWAGDFMDVTSLSDDDGVDLINYGKNSGESVDFKDGNYMTKDEYHLNDAYYSYYVNGYTSDGNTYKNNNKRISYVLEVEQDELASAYGVRPQNGVIIIKGEKDKECNRGEHAIGSSAKDHAFVYCSHCNRWFTYGTKLFGGINNVYEYNYYGLNYKESFFMDSDGYGNAQIRPGQFQKRHCTPDGNGWGSAEYAEVTKDELLACIVLKAYNTVSPEGLTATSTVNAGSKVSAAKPNLTSCVSLPGNNGDALYLGTMDSSGLINTTKGVSGDNFKAAGSDYTVDDGYGVSYVYIGDGEKTYRKVYDQTTLFNVQSALDNGGQIPIAPSAAYGYNSFKSEYNSAGTYLNSFETISDLRFTMGYSSDMYKLFSVLADADKKPLEQYYSASTGVVDNPNDHDSKFRQNLWFPREFLNITESDTYGKSVVAAGYDVGGYSQMYYQHLPEFTTTTNTRYLSGAQDMDWDNNGIIDYFDPDSDKYNTIVPGSTLIPSVNTALLQHTFNKDGHNMYFIDAQSGAGAGDGTKTMLALPQHITLSTVLDKVCNNAVISVYNESEAAFVPILYYKDTVYGNDSADTKNSVRFNCVSATGFNGNAMGIAAGTNNGKIFFVTPDYANEKISTDVIRVGFNQTKCKWWDKSGDYTSIDAVKAFNYTLYDANNNSTDYFCMLISGKSVASKPAIACATFDKNSGALVSYRNFYPNDSDADITDICVSNDYVYAVGNVGVNGVIYTASLKDIVTKTVSLEENPTTDWKITKNYSTSFSYSNDKIVGTNSNTLPKLNSVAAVMELD